ncbi:DBP2 [Plasmodium brasilianum]|uniref:DBP2 n=1 Tax=Plasmodium brasilianum TaxID=5824 RepID=A0ACB9YGP7_PLABR|nr:DBP2 [Plasmodium brasilianum]
MSTANKKLRNTENMQCSKDFIFEEIPQFQRWLLEWARDFGDEISKHFDNIKSVCKEKNVSIGKDRCNVEPECKKKCSEYESWIREKKKQLDILTDKFNRVKYVKIGHGGTAIDLITKEYKGFDRISFEKEINIGDNEYNNRCNCKASIMAKPAPGKVEEVKHEGIRLEPIDTRGVLNTSDSGRNAQDNSYRSLPRDDRARISSSSDDANDNIGNGDTESLNYLSASSKSLDSEAVSGNTGDRGKPEKKIDKSAEGDRDVSSNLSLSYNTLEKSGSDGERSLCNDHKKPCDSANSHNSGMDQQRDISQSGNNDHSRKARSENIRTDNSDISNVPGNLQEIPSSREITTGALNGVLSHEVIGSFDKERNEHDLRTDRDGVINDQSDASTGNRDENREDLESIEVLDSLSNIKHNDVTSLTTETGISENIDKLNDVSKAETASSTEINSDKEKNVQIHDFNTLHASTEEESSLNNVHSQSLEGEALKTEKKQGDQIDGENNDTKGSNNYNLDSKNNMNSGNFYLKEYENANFKTVNDGNLNLSGNEMCLKYFSSDQCKYIEDSLSSKSNLNDDKRKFFKSFSDYCLNFYPKHSSEHYACVKSAYSITLFENSKKYNFSKLSYFAGGGAFLVILFVVFALKTTDNSCEDATFTEFIQNGGTDFKLPVIYKEQNQDPKVYN